MRYNCVDQDRSGIAPRRRGLDYKLEGGKDEENERRDLGRFTRSERRSKTTVPDAIPTNTFDDEKDEGSLVSRGVEFIHGGKTYTVYARKEVILSAG